MRRSCIRKSLFHEETIIWYFFQLASAVDHIHDFGILHRYIHSASKMMKFTMLHAKVPICGHVHGINISVQCLTKNYILCI